MTVTRKLKHKLKTGVIAGAAVALVTSPGVAIAHGGWGGDRGDHRNDRSHARHVSSNDSARDRAAQGRWWHKPDPDPQPPKTCEQRQNELNEQAAKVQQSKQKQLNGINIIYSGVNEYVAGGEVVIENYDTLKASADVHQANASAAVGAIVAAQIDCNDQENSFVAAREQLRANSKAAKEALMAYGKDVKVLFEAAING